MYVLAATSGIRRTRCVRQHPELTACRTPLLSAALRVVAVLMILAGPARAQTAKASGRRVWNVGFERVEVRANGGPQIAAAVWYPTDAPAADRQLGGWTMRVATGAAVANGRHPLVVISHGHGGWFGGHYDTALALAHAGFVVAALTHPGDNDTDDRRALDFPARPRDLRRLVDYMLARWWQHGAVDTVRIGVFGFSAGGFTALVAAGAVPDFTQFGPHCRAHPSNEDCTIAREVGLTPRALAARFPPSLWTRDPRIKAAVIAAPGLGFTFTRQRLRGVKIPVQLWRAEDDRVLPAPDYADAVKAALPRPPEYHVVPGAGHYDFLAPCDSALALRGPDICTSTRGFDRTVFHAQFNREVVRFFRAVLMPVERHRH